MPHTGSSRDWVAPDNNESAGWVISKHVVEVPYPFPEGNEVQVFQQGQNISISLMWHYRNCAIIHKAHHFSLSSPITGTWEGLYMCKFSFYISHCCWPWIGVFCILVLKCHNSQFLLVWMRPYCLSSSCSSDWPHSMKFACVNELHPHSITFQPCVIYTGIVLLEGAWTCTAWESVPLAVSSVSP